MDANTYGGTPAAVTLVKLIEENDLSSENKKVGNMVGKIWSEYSTSLKAIVQSDMPSKIKMNLLSLLKEQQFKRCNSSTLLTEVIKSYLENIMMTKFREYKREYVKERNMRFKK
jgi:hypothetical protein